jgi:hypothetical protein
LHLRLGTSDRGTVKLWWGYLLIVSTQYGHIRIQLNVWMPVC